MIQCVRRSVNVIINGTVQNVTIYIIFNAPYPNIKVHLSLNISPIIPPYAMTTNAGMTDNGTGNPPNNVTHYSS